MPGVGLDPQDNVCMEDCSIPATSMEYILNGTSYALTCILGEYIHGESVGALAIVKPSLSCEYISLGNVNVSGCSCSIDRPATAPKCCARPLELRKWIGRMSNSSIAQLPRRWMTGLTLDGHVAIAPLSLNVAIFKSTTAAFDTIKDNQVLSITISL